MRHFCSILVCPWIDLTWNGLSTGIQCPSSGRRFIKFIDASVFTRSLIFLQTGAGTFHYKIASFSTWQVVLDRLYLVLRSGKREELSITIGSGPHPCGFWDWKRCFELLAFCWPWLFWVFWKWRFFFWEPPSFSCWPFWRQFWVFWLLFFWKLSSRCFAKMHLSLLDTASCARAKVV